MIEIIPPENLKDIITKVPGSKSYTNRALLLSSFTDGTSQLLNPLESEDTQVMTEALQNLGISINKEKDYYKVIGTEGQYNKLSQPISLANAGTAVRFLTAALTLQNNKYEITGSQRMQERPIKDLIDALKQLGANIKCKNNNDCPPIIINGGLKGGTTTINGTISSQYLSALLMISPLTNKETTINVIGDLTSKPYVDMTLNIMEKFGVTVDKQNFRKFIIKPQEYKACKYQIEGDASSATYPLAIAELNNIKATITNIPETSKQSDLQIKSVIKNLNSPGELDLNELPDAAMTVAILCAFSNYTHTLTNIGNLRVKETDRINALTTELRKIGATVEAGKDFLKIEGTPDKLHGATIETYNDHRMAMCFAVAGTKIPNIKIKNPECVNKTYPTFWEDLNKWGIKTFKTSKA